MAEWISVKERLPDDRHSVLVYCPYNKCIFTAYYDDFAGKWAHFGGCMPGEVYYPVSHWMPLPEPPEEGNNIWGTTLDLFKTKMKAFFDEAKSKEAG